MRMRRRRSEAWWRVRGRIPVLKGVCVDNMWGASELWRSEVNGGRREKVVSDSWDFVS